MPTRQPNTVMVFLGVGASYEITDFCPGCMTPTQTQFKNLSRGVESYANWTNRALNIDHAVFTNTFTGATDITGGILMANIQGSNIKRCSFDLADGNSEGITMYGCQYYTIAGNTLVGNGGGAGIFVSQSKGGDHRIYRNNFEDHYIGVLAQYENSAYYINPPSNLTVPNDGLVINCNTFDGTNDYNIAMTGYSVAGQYPCVARNQGVINNLSNPDPNKLVRNRYSATCGNDNQWHISFGQSIKSVGHAANNDVNTRPPQPGCADALVQIQNAGVAFSFSAQCTETLTIPSSTPTCPCPSCCRMTDINQGLATAISNRNTWVDTYNNTIDGGNTAYLLDEIASGALTSTDMKDLIKQFNPYLSDDVLGAFFSNTVVTADDAIFIHNENRPVTPSLWSIIEARGFSGDKMKTMIENQSADPISLRQILENEVSFAKSELSYLYGQKLNYFITDTVAGARDSLIHLLATNPGDFPDAVTRRVDAYGYAGYYTRAFAYADSLLDFPEYEDLVTLQVALLQLDTSQNKAFTILSNENLRELIEEYASDSTRTGCYQARAILKQVYGKEVFIFRLYPMETSERLAIPMNSESNEINKTNSIGTENQLDEKRGLKLFPNPSSDRFTLIYNSSTSGRLSYQIHNVLGYAILEGEMSTNKAEEVDGNMLINGIYFITLIQNGKIVEKQKLIIMK